jgi:hypothetical protein
MIIACLGWGSLIWNPGSLRVQNTWFENGVFLPIEFTRISNDNRVTLIIDDKAKPVRTLWSLMLCETLAEAKASLALREGLKAPIHSTGDNSPFTSEIRQWAGIMNIDHVIWTGLSYKEINSRPSIDAIISHLKGLEGNSLKKAEEYIRRAPLQIDTEYRRTIEAEFGWHPLSL